MNSIGQGVGGKGCDCGAGGSAELGCGLVHHIRVFCSHLGRPSTILLPPNSPTMGLSRARSSSSRSCVVVVDCGREKQWLTAGAHGAPNQCHIIHRQDGCIYVPQRRPLEYWADPSGEADRRSWCLSKCWALWFNVGVVGLVVQAATIAALTTAVNLTGWLLDSLCS